MLLRILTLGGVLAVGASVQAFCGFIVAGHNAQWSNDASQAVMLRTESRTCSP